MAPLVRFSLVAIRQNAACANHGGNGPVSPLDRPFHSSLRLSESLFVGGLAYYRPEVTFQSEQTSFGAENMNSLCACELSKPCSYPTSRRELVDGTFPVSCQHVGGTAQRGMD